MDWIETYNVDRTHSSLSGRTPLQAWAEDQTPLHRPDPEWLRLALLASGTRTVSGKGVRFDKIDYIDPGLAGLSGREVEVRYLPHDRSFVEVFVDGEWRCTARPHNTLTAEQQHELARIKREQYTTAANYAALAAQRRQIRAAQSRTTGPLRSHPDELSDEDLPESLRRSTPEATTHVDVLAAVFEHDMAPTDTATTTTYKSRTLPSQPQPTIPPPPSVPMPSVGSEPWELLADPSPKDHSR